MCLRISIVHVRFKVKLRYQMDMFLFIYIIFFKKFVAAHEFWCQSFRAIWHLFDVKHLIGRKVDELVVNGDMKHCHSRLHLHLNIDDYHDVSLCPLFDVYIKQGSPLFPLFPLLPLPCHPLRPLPCPLFWHVKMSPPTWNGILLLARHVRGIFTLLFKH